MNTAGTVILNRAAGTGGRADCAADACHGRVNDIPVVRWPTRESVIPLNRRPQTQGKDRVGHTARRPTVRIELKGRRT